MTPLPPGATIGILGGGQLGRMLAMAAARLGYPTAILAPEAGCPAAQVATSHIIAGYDDPEALATLAARCDVVTYEFENIPLRCAEALSRTVPVYPPPRALEVSQDRLAEKTFLNALGIGTAAFAAIDDERDLWPALEGFGGSGFLKTRRMGYDGKGQRAFRDANPAAAEGVFAALGGVPLILESRVEFEREISIIAARGQDGAMAGYDPVENAHRDGILRHSAVPAGINADAAAAARRHAFAILDALGYVGVLGVELFATTDGRLLVNEIAPRVHNSGHWTEAACAVSQFEQHIRAIAGLPLGTASRHFDAVMENLIGDEVSRAPALLAERDVLLHLYGKAEARPGRKMGHFTRFASPKGKT